MTWFLCIQYGVHLPERPPVELTQRIDPETMEDRFIYRVILTGIQDAVDVHMRGVIEIVRNDSLRQIFIELLKVEMGIYDKLLKYGKIKGWTKMPPMYSEGI